MGGEAAFPSFRFFLSHKKRSIEEDGLGTTSLTQTPKSVKEKKTDDLDDRGPRAISVSSFFPSFDCILPLFLLLSFSQLPLRRTEPCSSLPPLVLASSEALPNPPSFALRPPVPPSSFSPPPSLVRLPPSPPPGPSHPLRSVEYQPPPCSGRTSSTLRLLRSLEPGRRSLQELKSKKLDLQLSSLQEPPIPWSSTSDLSPRLFTTSSKLAVASFTFPDRLRSKNLTLSALPFLPSPLLPSQSALPLFVGPIVPPLPVHLHPRS